MYLDEQLDKGRTIRKVMGGGDFRAAGIVIKFLVWIFLLGHSMNIF